MSSVGYYRYKFSDVSEGSQEVTFYKNGALAKTCTIIGKSFCTGFKLLKYLDKDGQYRFFPFNNFWQQSNKPKLIGSVNNFVTSIVDSQTSKKNIGYKNDRTLTMTSENVSLDELEKLEDIYFSPRVYLYTGNGSNDRLQDWVLVSVSGDGIGRPKKNQFKKVVINVILPEHYAITKI
jgi:hypothetical protein